MTKISLEDIDNFKEESILDRIDKLEKIILAKRKKMPEFLLLDRMSYEQLKYERGIIENIDQYHGYTIGVVFSDFDEIIRFV